MPSLLALGLLLSLSAALDMNGAYMLSNYSSGDHYVYQSGHRGEYFDVYSHNISTRYSEVYWTTQPSIPLPADFVERFKGKIVAITGYEVDSVRLLPNGTEQSVPITEQYNHHHNAYLMGASAKMVDVGPAGSKVVPGHGGSRWEPRVLPGFQASAGPQVKQAAFIVDGNGGEYRKSFHGTASGFAMLVQDPSHFVLEPMMINTKNPNGSSIPGGPLPNSSLAPPDAQYSGLLECPCTDRKVKKIVSGHTLEKGLCQEALATPEACFRAAQGLGLAPVLSNSTVSSSSLPSGCSMVATQAGFETSFNTLSTSHQCGPSNHSAPVRSVSTETIGGVTVSLDLDQATATASISITGPAGAWFAAGFGGSAMQNTYAIVVDGAGRVTERALGLHMQGSLLAPSVTVQSSTVLDGARKVVLRRSLLGASAAHFSFDAAALGVTAITAVGSSGTLSYHKTRSSDTLMLVQTSAPMCVCGGGATGTIDGNTFTNKCAPQPTSDLLALKNDVCFIETYGGGLKCCSHQSILLDTAQEVPAAVDTYQMKFRLYFEEYSTQQDAFFMFWTNEEGAGEYDIPKCAPGTDPAHCVYTTTSTFKVRNSMRPCNSLADAWCAPNWNETAKVMLLRAGTHCHAPACLGTELYACPEGAVNCNASTGELICANTPIYGEGLEPQFDEPGYVAIPPCLWGPAPLQPPPKFGLDRLLHSVKRNNNTNGHWGVMGQWQMRGAFEV